MTRWFGASVLMLALVAGELELDCSRPGQARGVVGRWDQEKQQLEAKYRRMLSDFEERCRSSIGRVRPRIRAAS